MLTAKKLLLQSSFDGVSSGKAEALDRFYLAVKTLLSPLQSRDWRLRD